MNAFLRILPAFLLVPGLYAPTLAADPLATWHLRNSGTSENLNGVAFGNGRFVAVGDSGTILSSPDGIVWFPETNPTTTTLNQVVFNQGLFVAIGRSLTLLTSPDGQVWTDQHYSLGGGPLKIIHDSQRFILIKAGGGLNVSTNGINWTAADSVPVTTDIGGIAYGNGTYVEVGYKRTTSPPNVFSSPDLKNWTPHVVTVKENLFDAFYAFGLFFGFGQEGTLLTSPEGTTWTSRNSQTTGFIWDMATDGQHLVAASQWGRLLVSGNGLEWTRFETEVSGHLKSIAFGAQTFVAVGWDGAIVQSDPVATGPEPDALQLLEPTWVGNDFLFKFNGAVGQNYTVVDSTDGQNWNWVKAVACTQTPMPVTHAAASGSHRFYRVTQP